MKIASTRDEQLLNLRLAVQTDPDRTPLPLEQFEHQTLRPLLKWNHDWLLRLFKVHTPKQEIPTDSVLRNRFIATLFQQDHVLRNRLIGGITAQFTSTEWSYYITEAAEINRRISSLAIKRIQDTLL
jgi:hypothetical protein